MAEASPSPPLAPVTAVQPVVFDFLVQRVAVDAEAFGGLDLHAVALAEHLLDHLALDAVDDLAVQVGDVVD